MKEYDEGYADGFAAGEDECHSLRAENAKLCDALWQLLNDMGDDGLCVCQAAKEQAQKALPQGYGDDDA